MLDGKKVVVVMPAYNAAAHAGDAPCARSTAQVVDDIILVDDASHDDTVAVARRLGLARWCTTTTAATAATRRPATPRRCAPARTWW